MRSRRIRLGLWCVATALLLGGCRDESPPVIGVALSGSFVLAAQLALADAEADGSLPAVDTMMFVEVSSLARPAIEIATRLIARPAIVAVIGHSNSGASLAAAQLYNDAGVVQLAPTTTAELYSDAGPFSFRLVPPDDRQAAVLAQTVTRTFPAGARVALLYVNDDYGRGLRQLLRRNLDSTRYPIVVDLPHLDSDGRGEIVSADADPVARATPDVLLWLGRPSTLLQALPHLRQRLGAVPVLASDATASWTSLDNGDNILAGVQYIDFVDMESTPALRDFRARFASRFGKQAGGAEALVYDATRLVLVAIADGASTGEEVRAYFETLGRERPAYEGIAGRVAFTPEGDIERLPIVLTIPPSPRRP